MPDMAYLKVGDTSYKVKDITAQNGIGDINQAIRDLPQIRDAVATNTTNITQLQTATQDLPQIRDAIATNTRNITHNTDDIRDLKTAVAKNTIYDSASGSIASFPDGADDVPIKELIVNIDTVQAGTGVPAPDNIRPISGRTQAKVTRTGKNLFDKSIGRIQNKLRDDDGIEQQTYSSSYTEDIAGIKSDTIYTISGTIAESTGTGRIYFFDENHNWISQTIAIPQSTMPYTFTTPSGCRFIAIQYNNAVSALDDVQIEQNSTATTYEPYKGDTYNITFSSEAGTVYKGTLDVTTGVLTVTKAYALLNDADKWNTSSYATINYQYNESFSNRKIYTNSFTGLMCSYIKTIQSESCGRWYSSGGLIFGIYDANITLEQIKADATAGKIAICYDIATPIVYTLTAQQINTLLGQNNIWADTGNVSVTYPTDLKLYIDKKVAQ